MWGEGARGRPRRLLLLRSAAGDANPGACPRSEAAAAPAAPGRGDRVPTAPRRGEKPSRGPSVREPGAGACSFLAQRWGGGGPGSARAAAPRAGRGPPGRRGGLSALPRVARSGSLWRRLREMRRVHAVRGCGPALVACLPRPSGRSTAGRRQPLGTRRRGSRGAEGAAERRLAWRPRLASGRPRRRVRCARTLPAPPPPLPRPARALASRRCGLQRPPARGPRAPEAACRRRLGARGAKVAGLRFPDNFPGAYRSAIATLGDGPGVWARRRRALVAGVALQLRVTGIKGF